MNDPLNNPTTNRALRGTVDTLRELLSGSRCIACCRFIGRREEVGFRVYDLSVCQRPACLASILDTPLSDLEPDDDEGTDDAC